MYVCGSPSAEIIVRYLVMRTLLTALILLVFLGCSNSETNEAKVYSMEDVAEAGFKMKKDFKTEFPQSTDAKWGFYDGREIAIFRYPTVELADTIGKTAGEEQTEKIEVKEKNYAFGSKVERTMCRGDRGATRGQVASGLKLNYKAYPSFENSLGQTVIMNNMKLFDTDIYIDINHRSGLKNCPRREPIYLEFIIRGNLIILGEPMPGDDSAAIIEFLENAVSDLP